MKIIMIRDSDDHLQFVADAISNRVKIIGWLLEADIIYVDDLTGNPDDILRGSGRSAGHAITVIDTEALAELPKENPFL